MEVVVLHFRHEALCIDSDDGLAPAVVPVVVDALDEGATVVLAARTSSLERVRAALGSGEQEPEVDRIVLVDTTRIDRNPGRLIDVWTEVLGRSALVGRPVVCVHLPDCGPRTDAESIEALLHEHLVESAFDQHPGVRMVCGCEARASSPRAVGDFLAAHRYLRERGGTRANPSHRPLSPSQLLDLPLDPPAPSHGVAGRDIDATTLPDLRDHVRRQAHAAGLAPQERVDDLVLAASEIGANSVLHGGGTGRLETWVDGRSLWCEIRDQGHIHDPLLGRRRVADEAQGGRGIWIAHRVCDLVQLRSGAAGTTVRLRMDLVPGG
jgi:anti-sigma regulatory factor (Ser/Thr protein kinase)